MPADLRARLARWETLTVFLLIAAIVYGATSTGDFLTGGNFNALTSNVVEVALMALAMTFIIVAAEIDLSVASILGLSSALLGYLWNHNWPMEGILPVVLLAGVSIFGGKGKMWAVVIAVFLLGTIRNALTLNDVSDEILTIVTGSLLLLSVLGPSVAARIAPRLRRPIAVQPIEGGS